MNARDLSNHLASLLRKEREAMADFLLALADFDEKKLWRDLGHTSLFSYLRRELGLSAGAAQHRKTAVELSSMQQLPAVETALRQGRLCLSSVCELAKVVTSENVSEVLPRFFGLSRREAGAVAASIRPAAAIPQREVVTPVRAIVPAPTAGVRREKASAEAMAIELHPGETAPRLEPVLAPPAAAAPARPPDSEQPLTRTRAPPVGGTTSSRPARCSATRSWTGSRGDAGNQLQRSPSAQSGQMSVAAARNGTRAAETRRRQGGAMSGEGFGRAHGRDVQGVAAGAHLL